MTETAHKTTVELASVPADTPAAEIKSIVERDGGVILERFFSQELVDRFNEEIDPYLAQLSGGPEGKEDLYEGFHGSNTKRLTNVVTHSKTFREQMIQDPRVLEISDAFLLPVADSYQMSAAQVIEIGPGNPIQPRHRDMENWPLFRDLGASADNVTINFLTALCDFTEEKGATRVIPGSGHWDDFNYMGEHEDTIPALLNTGDVLLIDGKVVHGGGANTTADQYRRAMAWSFTIGWLASEEAHAFVVPMELVKEMPPKIQGLLGFRSFHNSSKNGGTLWQVNYDDVAKYLGL